MRYQLLGKSGLRVSNVCLGTMTFGEEWGWGASKDECRKIYAAFRDAGGNFIDTADRYTEGTSERLLGEFMQGHRDEVVLATKYTLNGPGRDPNAAGNHRKHMMRAVEASLDRLRTSYIDLYWMHIWDRLTPLEEVLRGFDDLVRSGKVLYVGVSDVPAWWLARAQTVAELRAWTPFVALQIEYSLLQRTPERELLPAARELSITTTAWSPLAGGVLSGKYLKHESGRLSMQQSKEFGPNPELANRVLRVLISAAEKLGVSPAQLALAWLCERNQPIIPILGATKLAQLQDNMRAAELKIPREVIAELDSSSAIERGFPYDFYDKDLVKSFVYGGMRDSIDGDFS